MQFFPSGIAEGEAFCNRVTERKHLKQFIDNVQHTVLMAPRRYGKSSLITQVIRDNKYKHVWLDFLSMTTKEEVEEKIKTAVKQMLLLLAPELKKLQVQTLDKVKSLSPELSLSALGQSLTLHLSPNDTTSIDQMLTQLDKYAEKTGKKAVLVFDEFQQISELKENKSIEALIRHAVERSKAITYLFSGSNRHMLHEMFSRSSRPLYRLCNVMTLDRIKQEEYVKFIHHASKLRWNKALSEKFIEKILALTECHPFYVNALCCGIWFGEKSPTSVELIESAWRSYIIKHKSIVISDIVALPLNQKKMIKLLSNEPEREPYSSAFSIKSKISTASIRRALEALLLKDIVFEDEHHCYRVLDPAVSYYFKYLH